MRYLTLSRIMEIKLCILFLFWGFILLNTNVELTNKNKSLFMDYLDYKNTHITYCSSKKLASQLSW